MIHLYVYNILNESGGALIRMWSRCDYICHAIKFFPVDLLIAGQMCGQLHSSADWCDSHQTLVGQDY